MGPATKKSRPATKKSRPTSKNPELGPTPTPRTEPKPKVEAKFLSAADRERYKKKHQEGLTEKEVAYSRLYCGDEYKDVNAALRGGFGTGSQSQMVQALDKILSERSFDTDVKVTRFAGPSALKRLGSLKAGDTFTDKGFVSTTAVGEDDLDDVLAGLDGVTLSEFKLQINIIIPKGKPAAFVPSGNPYEEEILLPRNSTFKVLAKKLGPKITDDRVVILDVELT